MGVHFHLPQNQLDKLFDTILTFAGITRRLHDTVEDIYRARGEVQARAEERQAQGRWAMTREETAETGELQNQLQQLHSQIEEVAKEYSNHLEHLLQLLPLQKHVDLTSLAFRCALALCCLSSFVSSGWEMRNFCHWQLTSANWQ